MKQRRNTILWAIGWWIVRRQVRRRAAVAFADVGAAAQRGRLRAVLGAVVLVGLLAAAFVAARRLRSGEKPPATPHDETAEALREKPPETPLVPDAPTAPIPGPAAA